MLCIKLHPPNIENAPPLNRSCTPSEPKLHPLNGFLSKLESFANGTRINPVFMRVFHTHIAKSKHIYVGEQISVQIANFVPQWYICGTSREIGSFLIPFLRNSNVYG